MRRLLISALLTGFVFAANSQEILSLEDCRALAIDNNKDLMISNEKIKSAHYERKAAFTNYLPDISAKGAYLRMGRELSLLSHDQKNSLSNMGSTVNGTVQDFASSIATSHPDLAPLISSLGNASVDPLNGIGSSLVNDLHLGAQNIYVGTLTLTQPIYMGGKIRAYHKITKYAEEMAHQQHSTELQELILSTDQAYWQVVSLVNKKKLAESYLKLLTKMDSDMEKMIYEGVATMADGLSVRVKVNEAEMTLTKVNDGLSLAKMLLCQICGLDLTSTITLRDEFIEDIPVLKASTSFDMEAVYGTRPEVRSLELATKIYKQKIQIERSEHLPSVVLLGNYLGTNPSAFNGMEKKFKGMWNVGVGVQVPIWHWGEARYKVKSAKAEARMTQYQLDDVKEKIELQVNQSVYKVNEAVKKLSMTQKNMEKANENLRYATLGFEEGVIPTLNLLEAQTAWLSAQSEKIDAQIDMKLTDLYLRKSLGTLSVEH